MLCEEHLNLVSILCIEKEISINGYFSEVNNDITKKHTYLNK